MIVVVFLFLKSNLFTHSEWVVLESVFLLPVAPPWCLDLFFEDVGSSSADIGRLLEASIGAVAIPEGITFEVKSQLRLVKSRSSSIFNEASPLKNKFQILNNEHLVTILTFQEYFSKLQVYVPSRPYHAKNFQKPLNFAFGWNTGNSKIWIKEQFFGSRKYSVGLKSQIKCFWVFFHGEAPKVHIE